MIIVGMYTTVQDFTIGALVIAGFILLADNLRIFSRYILFPFLSLLTNLLLLMRSLLL